MSYKLAGHTMVSTPHGDVCESCGRTWAQMLQEREYWRPGALGVAHVGGLLESELAELNARLDRIWGALAA